MRDYYEASKDEGKVQDDYFDKQYGVIEGKTKYKIEFYYGNKNGTQDWATGHGGGAFALLTKVANPNLTGL